MTNEAIHQENYKGFIIKIYHDEIQNETSRDRDNLGTMACFHTRYTLGDTHKLSVNEAKQITDNKNFISLPLYLYDHSGITMNTTGFHCQWDSGQVGFIFVSREKIRKEFSVKRISPKLHKRVIQYLVNEVKTYDDYLTGNVYGYVIENLQENQIDSCWGYSGDYEENALSEAKSVIDYKISIAKKEVANHVIGNNPEKILEVLCLTKPKPEIKTEYQTEMQL